jgi:hypothetical protein
MLPMLALFATMGSPLTVSEQVNALWPLPEEEKWMEVGWHLDLFEARREAYRQNKPIFMWMMNGHPTGCT